MKKSFILILLISFLITNILAYDDFAPEDERFGNDQPHEYFDKFSKENPYNHQICEQETNLHLRDICLQSFALETKDQELCYLMSDSEFKQSCYQYTDFKLDLYWSGMILLNLLLYGLPVLFAFYLNKKTKKQKITYAILFGLAGLLIFNIGLAWELGANEGGNPLFSRIPENGVIKLLILFPASSLGHFWIHPLFSKTLVFIFFGLIGFLIGYFMDKRKKITPYALR